MDKNFWKPILKELGFPEEKYNILENKSPLEEMSTLPMTLKFYLN